MFNPVINNSLQPTFQINNTNQTQYDVPYADKVIAKLFGNEEQIKKAIAQLRNDRLFNKHGLTLALQNLSSLAVDEELIQNDPFIALLALVLRNNPHEDILRDRAVSSYSSQQPDCRFEKAYAYLKTPHILIAHLLITRGEWKCANPENTAFYDEQIAGLFHGTVAFDKGDMLSKEELEIIQKQEGEQPRFPIAKKLVQKGDSFEVTDWCSTPPMCLQETRLDDLFIASRRFKQESIVTEYVEDLKTTSGIIQKTYDLPTNKSCVVALIGPYGSGKSGFVTQKFNENITTYSLDKLNTLLMEPTSHPQDHHFEAMMLTNKLLSKLGEIPALLTETAAIDEFRFNRLVNRDFSARDLIIIEEIAPEKASDAVKRYIEREKIVNQSMIGLANTSANDAFRYRAGRIEKTKENTKIDYRLYCVPTDGNFKYVEVAKVVNGELSVNNEELYKKLI